MSALAPAVRAALLHARPSRWSALAGGCGALVACLAAALVSPLALAGGARVEEAAALFGEELARYRAASAEARPLPLVQAATAGFEDRAFFHRPRWVPPVSPSGLARALARNLRGVPQGGSTIPQQLAKLYLREGQKAVLLGKAQ